MTKRTLAKALGILVATRLVLFAFELKQGLRRLNERAE
jgi:hypothetical protein